MTFRLSYSLYPRTLPTSVLKICGNVILNGFSGAGFAMANKFIPGNDQCAQLNLKLGVEDSAQLDSQLTGRVCSEGHKLVDLPVLGDACCKYTSCGNPAAQ